jgi:uncharacterized protein (DUF934 family)
MPIVTDDGFTRDATPTPLLSLAALESGGGDAPCALEVANDTDARHLVPHFASVELIAVTFPDFADGRGFSLARRLRALGYRGRLRAKGHVIADQYPMARACGFDEVEIADDLAARQPEAHWVATASLRGHALQVRR